MADYSLYFATNREHTGRDRWKPTGYGRYFSEDGAENLRFGLVNVRASPSEVTERIRRDVGFGAGDGEALSEYFTNKADTMRIEAFEEKINPAQPDSDKKTKVLGSLRAFTDMQAKMKAAYDVLIYIHGFNVSWSEAVGSALALQEMLNQPLPPEAGVEDQTRVVVFLFTWPSDGLALPYVSYKSDRTDAEASGYAVGRGLLKLRDFLAALRTRSRAGELLCDQEMHLLCHSMGNYVLQNTVKRLLEFNRGLVLPRLFEHIFMCAPDVNDNVFEFGQPLERLPELTRAVSVYHNKGDVAMYVSDYTKQNPDRLGMAGAAKPGTLHNKIQQVDCTPIVRGFVEHSYYRSGRVNEDIRMSIQGLVPADPARPRYAPAQAWPNVWTMR
jgi:esterase/lipase superfamily enzyme